MKWFAAQTHIAILLGGLIVAGSPLFAADEESADKENFQTITTGFISGKYVIRATEFEDEKFSDQDIFGQFKVDLTAPKHNLYEAHVFGSLRSDQDGDQNHRGFFPFEDAGDISDQGSKGYLYEAHLDFNYILPGVKQLRLGRQSGQRGEVVFYDGVAADFRFGRKFQATAYGGRTVHFHEVDPGDDQVLGAGVDFSPARQTRFSLDYLGIKDERDFLEDEQKDRLVAFKIAQRLSETAKATLRYRWINGEARDFRLNSTGFLPHEFQLSISYFQQFRAQRELTDELSEYAYLLGTTHPYQTLNLNLRKQFSNRYSLDLSYFRRGLVDDQNEGEFNRDYWRTLLSLHVDNFIKDNLSLSLTGEHWESEQSVNAAGADLMYRFKWGSDKAKVHAGTYYSLYKYDYYSKHDETEDVRTYYVKGQVPLFHDFSFKGSYEWEDGFDKYYTLSMGVRYDF
ncbi:MAG: hypothetical protein HQM14_04160 [SAR324 cluster bacterium]|nr:hypothetical protein [SAR324 cluster bacterium]